MINRYMRTRVPVGAALVTLLLLLVAVTGCSGPEEPLVEPLSAEEVSGERLWQRITEEADFTTYDFWPGHDGYQQGQAPHGPIHRIFVNQPLVSQLPLDPPVVPDGSIIVKENRQGDRTLTGYTVMAKVDGFSEGTNDWFWARYTPDGSVSAEGTVGNCIACHAGVRDNDFIIVYPLDRDPE